jgi:hypothetical protein
MSALQLKIYGYASVVGLCGIVFGLLGGGLFIVMFLGHLSNGVINGWMHLSYPQYFALTGLIAFGCGFNFGRNEARRKFLQ